VTYLVHLQIIHRKKLAVSMLNISVELTDHNSENAGSFSLMNTNGKTYIIPCRVCD